MRRTAPPSRPYGRYAVGLRPSLDPDADFDVPSQDKEAHRTNQNNTAVGLDRPLSFRNDLREHCSPYIAHGPGDPPEMAPDLRRYWCPRQDSNLLTRHASN
jgi:hypothetical protein